MEIVYSTSRLSSVPKENFEIEQKAIRKKFFKNRKEAQVGAATQVSRGDSLELSGYGRSSESGGLPLRVLTGHARVATRVACRRLRRPPKINGNSGRERINARALICLLVPIQ